MTHKLEDRVRFGYFGGNPMKKYLLVTLASYADADGLNAYPSVETLAAVMECSERSVRNKLRELEDEGLLLRTETERWSKVRPDKRPNPYRIVAEKIPHVARNQVRNPLQTLMESRSTEPNEEGARGAGDAPRGGQEMPPTTPENQYSSNKYSPPLYIDAGASESSRAVTEPQSVQGGGGEKESEERRDGVGDDHLHGEPLFRHLKVGNLDPRMIEAELLDPSKLTAEPDSFTDSASAASESISVGARPQEPISGPTVVGVGNLPTVAPGEPAVPPQAPEKPEYQEVDRKRSKFGWRPSDQAYEHARAVAPDVNLELIITEYWLWCHKKSQPPSASHWMTWVTREQKRYEELVREQERKRAAEERRGRSWNEKMGIG